MSEERDRLRAAGYDPEAMTQAEVVEVIGLGLVPGVCPVQIPQPEFTVVPVEALRECEDNPRAAGPMKVNFAELRDALGDEVGYVRLGTDVRFVSNPARKPCPHPRVLRPCERRAPSRLSRLAPGAIAALLGSIVGTDPSFESYERDHGRGSE